MPNTAYSHSVDRRREGGGLAAYDLASQHWISGHQTAFFTHCISYILATVGALVYEDVWTQASIGSVRVDATGCTTCNPKTLWNASLRNRILQLP